MNSTTLPLNKHPNKNQEDSEAESGSHILVVDDDITTVKVVSKYLGDAGYKVSGVSDSREVLSSVHQYQPDMVLLDIFMPHVNGLDILKQIRANKDWDHIIVLMISSAGKEERYQSLEMGAFGFIQKPVAAPHLLEEVTKAFRVASRFGAC